MRPEKWRLGSARKILRLAQKRFFEPWLSEIKFTCLLFLNSFFTQKMKAVFHPTFNFVYMVTFTRTPLDLSFWSFLTFLHHDIEQVEGHLVWKVHKKIQRKSWSNVPPKLLACIGFLYKVVHKIGRLRKFNRSREIEFNFITAGTISMKFGTLVHHASGYRTLPQIFQFLTRDLVMVFQSRKNGVKSSRNFERS